VSLERDQSMVFGVDTHTKLCNFRRYAEWRHPLGGRG
jgi:hypothetical protein